MELLKELIEVFRNDAEPLGGVAGSGSGRRTPSVVQAAHTLKGVVGFFQVPTATEAARELEKLGRRGDLAAARDALAGLEGEIDRIHAGLAALDGLPDAEEKSPTASASVERLQRNVLLERVGGDARLLDELIAVLQTDGPQLLAEISKAVDTRKCGPALAVNSLAQGDG